MRFKTTLTLAIAASLLVLYAMADQMGFFAKLFHEKIPEFPEIDVRSVTAIEIENSGGSFRLENQQGKWWVTKPFKDFAAPDLMADFLRALSALKVVHYTSYAAMKAEGNSAGSYGFIEGKNTSLHLHGAGENSVVLLAGDPAGAPNTSYFRVRSPQPISGVFTLSGDVRPYFDKPPHEYLDPILARFDPSSITDVQLFQGGTGITLKKHEATGNWNLKTPLAVRADNERINGLLNRLAGASILGIAPVTQADQILTESESSHTKLQILEANPQRNVEITFIPGPAGSEHVYAKTSIRPRLYEVDARLLTATSVSPAGWRDRRLLRIEEADVEKLTILPPGGPPVELVQLGTVWMFAREGGGVASAVNQDQAAFLFSLLEETTVKDDGFVSDSEAEHAKFGLTEPLMTLQFEGPGIIGFEANSNRIVMRIGRQAEHPSTVFVNFRGEPFVYAVRSTFYHALQTIETADHWKNLEVLNIAYEAIRKVRISQQGRKHLEFELDMSAAADNPENVMRLREGGDDVGENLDRRKAGEFLQALGVLTADRWVSDTTRALGMLSRPELTLEIDYHIQTDPGTPATAANPEPVEVQAVKISFAPVNPDAPNAYYYGRIGEAGDVFLIEKARVEDLTGQSMILR